MTCRIAAHFQSSGPLSAVHKISRRTHGGVVAPASSGLLRSSPAVAHLRVFVPVVCPRSNHNGRFLSIVLAYLPQAKPHPVYNLRARVLSECPWEWGSHG